MASPETTTTPAPTAVDKPVREPSWLVVVRNDPVNLMSYVVMVFRRVFGYSQEKATKHMLEVHEQGRSVVWQGERERAEAYVLTLQKWQLSAQLEANDA